MTRQETHDPEEEILDRITRAQNERDLEKTNGGPASVIYALQQHIDNLYAEYFQLTKDQ